MNWGETELKRHQKGYLSSVNNYILFRNLVTLLRRYFSRKSPGVVYKPPHLHPRLGKSVSHVPSPHTCTLRQGLQSWT